MLEKVAGETMEQRARVAAFQERILVMEITADASEYTTVFGIVAAVSNLAIFVKKMTTF